MQLSRETTMSKHAITLAGLLLAGTAFPGGFVHAAGPVGQITHLSGLLTVKRPDGTSRVLAVKSEVGEGDTLTTEQETYARIKFADNGEVVLRPGTQLKVEAYAFDQAKPESDNVVLNMLKGGLRAVTGLIGRRSRNSVNFATATATIGIRGTHFGALLCQNDCLGVPTITGKPPENGLHVDVTDGAIVVQNPAGQQVIASGQFGFVRSATTAPVIVPPQQGIQVTMPVAISRNAGAGRGVGKAKENECAVQ
ncbi:MAG: FecR domain-containing protein [Betaproteobacteria bacterium]|nr:FecR domain-containing protein [Betaproteobacteria bacterium]